VKRSALPLAVLGLAALAPLAAAQEKKAPAPSASASASAAPPAHVSALAWLAGEIASGLGQVPPGALVVASPLTSDLPAPKGDDLATRIAAQVSGRLGVKAHPSTATLAVARGHAGRAASLVYLQVEIAKGELRITADLYPSVSNGWERLRNPVPGPRAHAFATAPLDAEIRSFLTPVALEQLTLHKSKHDESDVVAVGCGDVDGDGGNELVLVSRARVALGKLRAGRFVASKTVPWAQIASRSPVPMREPLASVVFRHGEILVGSTDRGGVALDASLVTKRQLTGLPIPGAEGEACIVPLPEASTFEGNGVGCVPPAKGDPQPVLMMPFWRYDAAAAFDAIGRDGSVTPIVGAREATGRLRLRRHDPGAPKAFETTLEGVGAQLAIADLDLDGTPEVVTTTENDADMLVVSSMTKNGVTVRQRYPAKDGVRAVAICPPEEKGVPAVVAVVGSEVWLVR